MLLKFSGSLAKKCISIHDEPCMTGLNLIDLNPNELHYYPFMASLRKCNGSCNIIDNRCGRICVLNKIEHNRCYYPNKIEHNKCY